MLGQAASSFVPGAGGSGMLGGATGPQSIRRHHCGSSCPSSAMVPAVASTLPRQLALSQPRFVSCPQETQNSASPFPTIIRTQLLSVLLTLLSSQVEKLRPKMCGWVRTGSSGLPLSPSWLWFLLSWLITASGRATCSHMFYAGHEM